MREADSDLDFECLCVTVNKIEGLFASIHAYLWSWALCVLFGGGGGDFGSMDTLSLLKCALLPLCCRDILTVTLLLPSSWFLYFHFKF